MKTMKKIKVVLAAGAILIAGAFFFSCQKEQITTPVKEQGTMILKADYGAVDCETYCIEDGYVYQTTTSFTRQWSELSQFPGYYRNNKYFTATAFNDLNNFYITVNVFGYQYNQQRIGGVWTLLGPTYDNYPFTDVLITLNGTQYNYSMDDPATTDVVETATTYTQSFPLPEGWDGCDEWVYTVRLEGDGQWVRLGTASAVEMVTYSLFDDENCCTPGFSYVDNGDDTYTFTFVPEVSTMDAFVEFTFPQGVVISAPEGWTQPGQGHVRQITTDLEQCVPFVFTFGLVHSEPGQGPLWTDFKVNGEVMN